MIKRGGAGLKFDNDFFNTEVRDGFEISSMMKRAWAAQMEVFQVVSDICNRNGIRYFADLYRPPKVRPKNLTIGGRYFYG